MADQAFQIESVGSVYAEALINAAQKAGVLNDVTDDVRGIGELLKGNAQFRAFVAAVTIGEEERASALDKIFNGRVHVLTLNTLKALSRRGRLMFLSGFVAGFETILKKMSGHVSVELTSATDLKPETIERIKAAVGKQAGGTADLTVTIDRELIGGMVLKIGDTLIDGSVSTQLEKMKEALKKGGAAKAAAV